MRQHAVGSLSERALELAATGGYMNWQEVGQALEDEGREMAIYRLSLEAGLRRAIDLRCAASRTT